MPLILYVDDEPSALKYMQRALEGECELISCQEIEDALQVIDQRGEDLDVIIADERMPQMTGRDLLRVAQLRNNNTSRILTTAFADVSCLADCLNEGLLDKVILKPWDSEILADEVLSTFNAKTAAIKAQLRNEFFANLDASTRRLEMISSAFSAHAHFSDFDPDRAGLTALLENEVGAIGTIIDNAYASNTSQPMLLWKETCNLEDCLASAVRKLPKSDQQSERFNVELPAGPTLIRCSRSSTVMVLAELMSYAFFIARDVSSGMVSVWVEKHCNVVSVNIAGSGTVDLLDTARRILVGQGASSGLGLSVISWIVRQSGGTFKSQFTEDSNLKMTLTYPLLLN